MVKKGDTLVEVILAIGIFSMIAIAVASVMSGGTSGAQVALETTLAREEIDTQADSLRFIQSTATANKENEDQPLSALWKTITNNAININTMSKANQEKLLLYAPSSCSSLYSSSTPGYNNAFIINPRMLSTNPKNAYVKINSTQFGETPTYPRLVYGNSAMNDDKSGLADDSWRNSLYRAEGIYIIAVKDPGSTRIVDVDGETEDNGQAYYDFYIRSCWYGTGNTEPSTISTVVRLHDPNAVSSQLGQIQYSVNGTGFTIPSRIARSYRLPDISDSAKSSHYGYVFKGWLDTISGEHYNPNDLVYNTNPTGPIPQYQFIEDWYRVPYRITYDLNGSSHTMPSETCYQDEGCTINEIAPTRSGYYLKGWCKGVVNGSTCVGSLYQPGKSWKVRNSETDQIPSIFTPSNTLALKAVWEERNESITIKLTWGSSPSDLDSHITGKKSDGSDFHTYYGNKTYSEGRVIASLDRDITSGYGPETITLNTLGGRDYYYYVHCYSSCTKISGATVVVSGPYLGTRTFYSNNASGTGRYWNVFAYKDGQLVTRQTHTSSPESNY